MVLFTASGRYVGGSTMAMFNLMLGLARAGVRPLLVSTAPLPRYMPLYRRLASAGVKIALIDAPRKGVFHWPIITRAAIHMARWGDVELLHTHTPKEAFFISIAAKTTARRFLYTLEGDPLTELSYARGGVSEWVINAPSLFCPLRTANGLAACSSWLAETVKERYGAEAEPIPNPVDVERFSENLPMKKQEDGTKVVLALARLVRIKGIHTLLRAAALVLREAREAEFWVAGDGPMRQELQEEAKRLGVADRFKLLGYSTEPEKLLSQAYLLAMPSLYEPFGMPAAEAGAASKPIVAARTGGLQEIVEDGKTGLLHKPADYNDLADKLLTLLTDERLVREMGRRGHERVWSHFRPEVVARKYVALYESILR